jgi:choline-sulfatase
MIRRTFAIACRGISRSLGSFVVISCLFTNSLLPAAAPSRPNILWICADDLAAYACGAYGGQRARTPNIDRLAARGMRFDRAFCNAPVCTASRQSFLTGRYPRTIGVTQLASVLPESETTLAELLKTAGYETAAIGKMHFNSALRHGFDVRLDSAGHQQFLREHPARPVPADRPVLPPWRPFRDAARVWLNSGALPFAAYDADMTGTWLAGEGAKYLLARSEKDSPANRSPFLLMVSFYEPHSPFRFPVEYAGRHRADEFSVPRIGADDDDQIPAIFRDLTKSGKQGIAAAYHTSVEFLDKNIGVVLDALDRSGQAENTLVIFTGDHGYLLGHHGRFEKHCCFEEAIRAPLAVCLPGRIMPDQASSALVELIDIVPTVLDLCGITPPATIQGRTLVPTLTGRVPTHRDEVFIEYSENEEAAVRTDRWKFIYGTGRRERKDGYTTGRPLPGRTIRLYDLAADPEELTNLAGQPEHAPLIADFTRRLAEHLVRTARQPELVPGTDDVHVLLEFCLQPRDVASAK